MVSWTEASWRKLVLLLIWECLPVIFFVEWFLDSYFSNNLCCVGFQIYEYKVVHTAFEYLLRFAAFLLLLFSLLPLVICASPFFFSRGLSTLLIFFKEPTLALPFLSVIYLFSILLMFFLICYFLSSILILLFFPYLVELNA